MRKVQLNIRMTELEMQKLKLYAQKTNLSASAYIRHLINRYIPKETPPLKYNEFICKLNDVFQNAEPDDELRRILLQIQAELTLPDRRG